MIPTRRRFLTTAALFFAAPAIVRAASLMPVKAPPIDDGIPLWSSAHPWNNFGTPGDLTRESLERMIVEIQRPETVEMMRYRGMRVVPMAYLTNPSAWWVA